MPAPKKLRLNYGKLQISAFVQPMQEDIDDFHPICRACMPVQTKMRHMCEVTQLGFEDDIVHMIYQCTNCGRQWAWPFQVPHIMVGDE